MYLRREIGILGEEIACLYLLEHNHMIVETNFSCRQGEVDIIAYDILTKELAFIEVKTRTNLKFGNPIEAVDKNKQKRIKRVIKYYLYQNKIEDIAIRIDIVEVFLHNEGCEVSHLTQAILD